MDASWYQANRTFGVIFDDSVCGEHYQHDGKSFQLVGDPAISAKVQASPFTESVELSVAEIASGVMRYLLTADPQRYDEELFLVQRRLGLAFMERATSPRTKGSTGLAWNPGADVVRHREERSRILELFAYGVALGWTSQALGLDLDRFRFIPSGNQPTPDFEVRESLVALGRSGAASPKTVTADRRLLGVEVRGRCPFGAFRQKTEGVLTTTAKAERMLFDFARKAKDSEGAFLGVVVSVPGPDSKMATAAIRVADPGESQQLGPRAMGTWILDCVAERAIAVGLWGVARMALQLGDHLDRQRPRSRSLDEALWVAQQTTEDEESARLVRIGDTVYYGRFQTLAERHLGARHAPPTAVDVLDRRIAEQDVGPVEFIGVEFGVASVIFDALSINRADDLLAALAPLERFGLSGRAVDGSLNHEREPASAFRSRDIPFGPPLQRETGRGWRSSSFVRTAVTRGEMGDDYDRAVERGLRAIEIARRGRGR